MIVLKLRTRVMYITELTNLQKIILWKDEVTLRTRLDIHPTIIVVIGPHPGAFLRSSSRNLFVNNASSQTSTKNRSWLMFSLKRSKVDLSTSNPAQRESASIGTITKMIHLADRSTMNLKLGCVRFINISASTIYKSETSILFGGTSIDSRRSLSPSILFRNKSWALWTIIWESIKHLVRKLRNSSLSL